MITRISAVLLVLTSLTAAAYEDLISLNSSTLRGGKDPFTVIQESAQDKAVVLFYKPSCPYCSYLDGKFRALAQQNKDNAQFIMINIQQNDGMYKSAYGFSTVPTVVYFKNATRTASHGSDNKTITVQTMQTHVNHL